MEDTRKWRAVAAIAPIAWGSTYFVTSRWLPTGSPVCGAAIRALPAGLVLLALRPSRPAGAWWWKATVLGALNTGAFFGLVYVAAQRLPTSTASMVMANSPIALMLVAWLVLGERPRARAVTGAVVGIAGVATMLSGGGGGVDAVGVAASLAALAISAVGYTMAKRWNAEPGAPDVLTTTAWQLLAGGVTLVPVAVLVEGRPPAIDTAAAVGFAYVVVVATAVAFAAWFTALRHLPAGTVGLIGLLNPVTGVLLGVVLAGERLGPAQAAGIGLVFAGILTGQGRCKMVPERVQTRVGRDPAPTQPHAVAGCV
jgi:probable blue pigment (indigoidine) exporter